MLEQARQSVGSEQEERKGPTKIEKRKEPRKADGGKRFEDGPAGIKYEGQKQGREVYGSKKATEERNFDQLLKKTFEPMDFDEDDEYDDKLLDGLEGQQLKFPLRKLFYDEGMGGNYYVYGSKVILLKVNPQGTFVVRIHKTKDEQMLSTFLATTLRQEHDAILQLLKGPKKNLLDRDDPITALSNEVESLFRREQSFGYKRREDQ